MRETHAIDASVTPRVTSHTLILQNLTHGFFNHVCQNLLSHDLSLAILVDFTLRAIIDVIFILI